MFPKKTGAKGFFNRLHLTNLFTDPAKGTIILQNLTDIREVAGNCPLRTLLHADPTILASLCKDPELFYLQMMTLFVH
ncbi:MAG TPA: hypothetical protein VJZ49_12685 [Syntrophales bacterium]|nr:hypothetical protein [Syntrophales bacterium]